MPQDPHALSGYRAMWLFAMFDLPVDTPAHRRAYTQFRKALLERGFMMLQYSVYVRYCSCEEVGQRYIRQVRRLLPEEGQVRFLMVTDRQFGKMQSYIGRKRTANEEPPAQLELF